MGKLEVSAPLPGLAINYNTTSYVLPKAYW